MLRAVFKNSIAILLCGLALAACKPDYETFAYVGGWDWEGNVYPFRSYALDRETGDLSQIGAGVDLGLNPSTIVPSPDGRFLYVGHEAYNPPYDGISTAGVDRATGLLTPLAHRSFPNDISFVSLDRRAQYVLAASYGGGKVAAFPIDEDGLPSEPTDTLDFPAQANGDSAQTHSIRQHVSGRLYVAHKGLSKITILGFDPGTGQFLPNTPGEIDTAYAQPRHIDFTPDQRFLFASFESASMVAGYAIGADGGLTEVSALSTIPADFTLTNTCSHILIHPSGRFLYVANRGHDSIAVFAIDRAGKLTFLEHQYVEKAKPGDKATPWHFDIDPFGKLMVVVNHGDQDTQLPPGSLETFSIGTDGRLMKVGKTVTGLKSPISVRLITRPKD